MLVCGMMMVILIGISGPIASPVMKAADGLANDPPLANDDIFMVNMDLARSVSPPGVLANDTDYDEDNLTVNLINDVSYGFENWPMLCILIQMSLAYKSRIYITLIDIN